MSQPKKDKRTRHRSSRSAPVMGPTKSGPLTTFVDMATEWRASQQPLRHLMRRRANKLRSLPSQDRRRIEQLLFGYARLLGRVEQIVATSQKLLPVAHRRPSPRQLVIWACLVLETTETVPDDNPPLALRRLSDDEQQAIKQAIEQETARNPPDADDVKALAFAFAFPLPEVREFVSQLGFEQTRAALGALNQRALLHLRPQLPSKAAEVIEELAGHDIVAQPHPVIPEAVVLQSPIVLSRLPLQHTSVVQDAASQLAVQLLDIQPGQTVVDICAGGGGKASAIADRLEGEGRLILVDIDQKRLDRAEKQITGDTIQVETWRHDCRTPLPYELRHIADRVLVDAPCSGLGTVRRHPDLKWRYDKKAVKQFNSDQLAILSMATQACAGNALVAYLTCSLRRSENQGVVDKRPESLVPLPLQSIIGDLAEQLGAEQEQLTLWPHRHHCDGFFAALYRFADKS